MKNTHHAEMDELLIGRSLDWVEDGGIFREEPPSYKVASAAKRPPRTKCNAAAKAAVKSG